MKSILDDLPVLTAATRAALEAILEGEAFNERDPKGAGWPWRFERACSLATHRPPSPPLRAVSPGLIDWLLGSDTALRDSLSRFFEAVSAAWEGLPVDEEGSLVFAVRDLGLATHDATRVVEKASKVLVCSALPLGAATRATLTAAVLGLSLDIGIACSLLGIGGCAFDVSEEAGSVALKLPRIPAGRRFTTWLERLSTPWVGDGDAMVARQMRIAHGVHEWVTSRGNLPTAPA